MLLSHPVACLLMTSTLHQSMESTHSYLYLAAACRALLLQGQHVLCCCKWRGTLDFSGSDTVPFSNVHLISCVSHFLLTWFMFSKLYNLATMQMHEHLHDSKMRHETCGQMACRIGLCKTLAIKIHYQDMSPACWCLVMDAGTQ